MYICDPQSTSQCSMWPAYTWKLETPALGIIGILPTYLFENNNERIWKRREKENKKGKETKNRK
jgi:hypothetical protein